MDGLDHFTLSLYRFTLRVEEPMSLPAYKGAVLRGGFGITFKRAVCIHSGLPPCQDCHLLHKCPYPAIFEPSPPPDTEVLKTQSDVPLPFLIEPPDDRRTYYAPGQSLEFGVTLIGWANNALPYFIVVFQRLGEAGLGPDRARYLLNEVAAVDPLAGVRALVLARGRVNREAHERTTSYRDLTAPLVGLSCSRLTLHFLTPTRLKHDGRYVEQAPAFHVVLRALLRRVSSLSYFYGGQRWDTDYRGWIEQAERVRTAASDAHWVDWERYSTRQKQSMNLGGVVGWATYEGDLTPFLPLLRLGELVHVGKSAVFGNGRYAMTREG